MKESYTVVKRDGSKVPFDSRRIVDAIVKANDSCDGGMTLLEIVHASLQIEQDVKEAFANDKSVHVEQIQDFVENHLMTYGQLKVAKEYITYRSERSKARSTGDALMWIYEKITDVDARSMDDKRENANIDGDSAMGVMLKYGTEGSKFYTMNHVLPKDLSAAHMSGDIHIHDLDFFALTETCCQIDLLKLFKNGFSTGHGFLREPNSITSYAALACIAIQANQNDQHGGQSIPNFDYCMAPGVAKTFIKEYIKTFCLFMLIQHGFNTQTMKERIADIKVHLATPEVFPDALRQLPPMLHVSEDDLWKAHRFAFYEARKQTENLTYQAMEALVHNFNTLNSRAGSQVPFSSLNYGTDTSEEGRMVVRNLLKATQAGMGAGETPIFPVQIFKVKEGVNYFADDPNYDLFMLAIETTSKRLFPNFSFLDAPFNLQYYKPGDYNSEVAYMGCRTRVMGNVYDPEREVTCGRGNLSFTTINLPRLAIKAEGDVDAFFKGLEDMMGLVKRQLLHRLGIQGKKKVKNYPFLMGNGIWLDSDDLDWEDEVLEALKHGTLTIGFIGLAETLMALIGKHHGESEEAQELGLRIVKFMRDKCDEFADAEKLNFTLIATPAESLSSRFLKLDKVKFGEMEGITDKAYYTNSFHVPVWFNIKAFKKIEIEAPYHALTNAGHISYVELDGDAAKNPEAVKSILRFMHDKGIGYGSVNHPVDRDPVCGYTGVINGECPRCGRKEGEGVSVERLKELRKIYPDVPKSW